MGSEARKEASAATVERLRDNKEQLARLGPEPTLNTKGYTYHVFGEPEKHWLSSLPESPLPLLDAGACYGVQTIYALKSGRHVIALDFSEEHLRILEERVANLDHPDRGNLVRTIVAKLPSPHVLEEESVSGILCSEMLHFLQPGDLQPLLAHFFKWLAPGGLLVATAAAWPTGASFYETYGVNFRNDRSVAEILGLLKTLSPAELVEAAPGYCRYPDGSPWKKILGDGMYLLSTEELRELAESNGFVVVSARYHHSGKYVHQGSPEQLPESVLLVARKPPHAAS